MGLEESAAGLRDAQHAASECPNQATNWLVAARAYAAMGRPNGIDRIFSQALDENPQDLRIAKAYANWLLRDGREREAVAIARRLTRDSPASLSAWRQYEAVCQAAEAECAGQAALGLEDARTRFGIDLKPGTLAPNELFGRFVSR